MLSSCNARISPHPTCWPQQGLLTIVLLAALLFAIPQNSPGETMFVQPLAELSLRQGQGSQFKTVGVVRAGEQVEIQERANGWVRVLATDGRAGWLQERFLAGEQVQVTPAGSGEMPSGELQQQIKEQKSQLDRLTALNADNERRLAEYRDQQQEMADNSGCEQALADSEGQRRQLEQQLAAQQQQIKSITRNSAIFWFLAGAGVLLFGWLLGFFSRRSRRKSKLT